MGSVLTGVEGREFERHVVRVDRPDGGGLLGTGFFVAPGWVLTCAHVVHTFERVTIVPSPTVSGPVTARVEARSVPPLAGALLWPFPDLALLQLDSKINHPCVVMEGAEPDNSNDSHAWGFPQQVAGQEDPPGAPATFRFEGRQSDGYFKLKAGQAQSGLSGAPLLCPYHRAVVGVISATRDQQSALGGWAAPISALFQEFPGVPDELVALGLRVREEGRTSVLADRSSWHRVLPVKGSERLLRQPWESFGKKDGSSPADLLQANFGVVPYLFRDSYLSEAVAWCESAATMSVAMVVGDGGAGKSRFAIELCKRMIGRYWGAGHWPDEDGAAQVRGAQEIIGLPLPRLIVIDYAESFPVKPLKALLEELISRATELTPVRLLLLVRTASNSLLDVLEEIGRGTVGQLRSVLDAAERIESFTEALDPAQRRVLYATAVDRFREAWHSGPMPATALSAPSGPDLSGDNYRLPLEVLFEALDHALTAGMPNQGEKPVVYRVLEHEEKYWKAKAPAGLDEVLQYQCAALATLAGAADEDEANALLVAAIPALAEDSARNLREQVIEWLAGLYSGPGLFNPLRPDRLGEALVAGLLTGRNGRGSGTPSGLRRFRPPLSSVLTLTSHEQVANCLDLLARLTDYDTAATAIVVDAIAEVHVSLIAHAEKQRRDVQQRPVKMTVASGVIRLLAGDLGRQLIDRNPASPEFLVELASSFVTAGDLATSSTQHPHAERLYHYALQANERVFARGGAKRGYRADPATAHARLGALARTTGDSVKAESHYRQAVEAIRSLDADELNTRERRDLLRDCCDELSVLLNASKKRDEAQHFSTEAGNIRRGVRLKSSRPEPASLSTDIPGDARADVADSGKATTPDGPRAQGYMPRPAGERSHDGSGEIISFYSYKGGTGRTMTLANTAWILASNNQRVLAVDWNLDSPGLHQFFRPFLHPDAITATPGVVDLIREYQWATLSKEPRPLDYHLDYAQAQKYAISLDWDFPGGGRLDFLSAGRQNRDYSNTVASINWDEFYAEHGGGLFFDALRSDMRRNYDYVLIDSRSGISDAANICTAHLPDTLVDCFTLSDQGIEGAAAVARGIADDYPHLGIRILPVAMRVHEGEKEKIDAGRALARARFDGFPAGLNRSELTRYWGSVEIPFRPFYDFEETLAAFGDPPGVTSSVLSAMERLTDWITDGVVASMPPLPEPERLRILGAFARKQPPSPSDLLLAYVPEDRVWADWISSILSAASFTVIPVDVAGALPPDLQELTRLRTMAVVSPAFVQTRSAVDFARAVASTDPSGNRRQLVPVTVGEVRPVGSLTDRAGADLTRIDEAEAVRALLHALDHSGQIPAAGRSGVVRFPGSVPPVWNVQPRDAAFTGRSSVLEHLRDQLSANAVSVVLPVALHGLGGVGKTQVALEYAHRFRSDYDLVWWVDAEQPDQINHSLAELAGRLGIGVGESYTDAAYEVREKLRLGDPYNRWLLIFDNADDPADLRKFLLNGPGHVLITSRNQTWTQVADPLEVDVFSRAESTDLLSRRVPGLSAIEAQELADAVGDLPLAVEVAGAWLADSGVPVAEYIFTLRQESGTGVLSQSRPMDYPRSLEATWKISLDRLAARSQAALRLLEMCAFLAPDISVELLYRTQTIEALLPLDDSLREPMMFGRVIQEISRLALAKVDRQGKSIQVHRLVQSYLRDQMDEQKAKTLMHEVHRILAAARPRRGDTDDPKNWPQFQQIWSHLGPSNAASCDEESVRQLLIDRVRYLWKGGDYDHGLELALGVEEVWKAASIRETVRAEKYGSQDSRHLQLLYLQSQRANIYRSQGEIALAAELDRSILAEQRRALPADDLHTLITVGGMAADLRMLGRFAEALELDRTTHASLKQLFGENHARTLTAANNLGIDYRLSGDCFTALEYDRNTLENRRAVLGAEHPYTFSTAHSVARDLYEAGEYQQAVALAERTYNELVSRNETAMQILRAATLLGICLRYVGQSGRARSVTEETHAQYGEEFNADTLDAYACRLNLAADLAATGEIPAAIDLTIGVHSDYRRRLGPDHPFTLIALNNQASYLIRADRAEAAFATADECVKALRRVLSPDHRYTLTAELTLASCHAAAGRFQDAASLDEHCHSRLNETLGENHPTVLASGVNLANSMDATGRIWGLRPRWISLCTDRLGADHPITQAAVTGGRTHHELEPCPL